MQRYCSNFLTSFSRALSDLNDASTTRSGVVGFAYPSYSCYCALQRNATVTELVSRLTSWALVAAVVLLCTYVLDPVFGLWFPMYYPGKVAVVAWLAFPQTLGAETLLAKYVEPALSISSAYFAKALSAPRVYVQLVASLL